MQSSIGWLQDSSPVVVLYLFYIVSLKSTKSLLSAVWFDVNTDILTVA
jgi:hypothetical protein